jgi:hypothetical protein
MERIKTFAQMDTPGFEMLSPNSTSSQTTPQKNQEKSNGESGKVLIADSIKIDSKSKIFF